ncbi:MAG: PEGA domain-containing protein [Pseudomonadota bacterium]
MPKTDISAWLFVQGISREKWAMSPAPTIVRDYKGTQMDEIFVPGILLGFPSTKAAAKAAMRFHFDLAQMFGAELPPMVIDAGGNPRTLPTIAFGREPKLVILTPDAVRQLASEPIDLVTGPEVKIEGAKRITTRLMLPTDQNLGWALPAVQVAVSGAYPDKGGGPIEAPMNLPAGSGIPIRKSSAPVPVGTAVRFVAAVGLLVVAGAFLYERVIRGELLAKKEVVVEKPYEPLILPDRSKNPLLVEGTVVIRCEPADAQIYVDDRLVAKKSPAVLEKQSVHGLYKLMVKRKGYKPYTKIYNVTGGQRLVLDVKLEKGR